MVVVASPTRIVGGGGGEKVSRGGTGIGGGHVPVVDLSWKRSQVRELILKACQEYGFFKVVNHGVPRDIIAKMEKEGLDFFRKSASEKEEISVGHANPFGYGSKNIGFNGDVGEVEYLLLHTNPLSVSQASKVISSDPPNFSTVVKDYVEAVRDLACEILDLMAEGLRVHDKSILSSLIRDGNSDSLIRLNHYPSSVRDIKEQRVRVGFGEHSDPQILALLRSNEGGLQISLQDGVWVPVPPDPYSFCVNVGDALQVLTNGRFVSVRHRAMTSSSTRKSRMSMVYFGAPPLHTWLSPLPEMVTAERPSLYRPFTWAEFKKTVYSLRLGDSRLDLFRTHHPNNPDYDLAASLPPPPPPPPRS